MPTSPDPDRAETTPPGPSATDGGGADHVPADRTPADLAPLDAVRREVVLDAGPERVWAAMADDDGLSGWLADDVELEVHEGATGTVRDGDGPQLEVTVEEVVPGRRLGLAWRDVEDRPSLVDLTLEPVDEGRTRVVVVEVPLATLRLVAPAAERLLAGGRSGGGSSASAAWSGGMPGSGAVVGGRVAGGPSAGPRILAGAR